MLGLVVWTDRPGTTGPRRSSAGHQAQGVCHGRKRGKSWFRAVLAQAGRQQPSSNRLSSPHPVLLALACEDPGATATCRGQGSSPQDNATYVQVGRTPLSERSNGRPRDLTRRPRPRAPYVEIMLGLRRRVSEVEANRFAPAFSIRHRRRPADPEIDTPYRVDVIDDLGHDHTMRKWATNPQRDQPSSRSVRLTGRRQKRDQKPRRP